ncbi:MAG: fibronectin type III domain-containing protein [Thermoplasmata archaeon]
MTRLLPALAAVLVLVVMTAAPGPGAHPTTLRTAQVPAAPIVTAAPVNTTVITVSWSAPAGPVVNYTLQYAHFYGVPIANISVGTATVYNVTGLAFGYTYYFTVWAWNATGEGAPSNVAAAQTDPLPPVVLPFPWATLEAITTLSILGSMAVSLAIASFVSGRRGRRAENAAGLALARTAPRSIGRPTQPYSGPAKRPRS